MIEEIVIGAPSEGTRRRPRWWLIAKTEDGQVKFLTTAHEEDGGKTLPVFGHEEEAEMFLYLGGYAEDWSVRESSTGEIVSVLYGPCSDTEGVALDPLPRMLADGMLGLVRMERRRFLEQFLGRAKERRR